MAVAATSPAKGVVDVAYVACEGVAFYIQVPLKSAQLAHYSILLSPILKLRNPDLAIARHLSWERLKESVFLAQSLRQGLKVVNAQ